MSNFLITAYYTTDKIYTEQALHLKHSLEQFNIPYHIKSINTFGNWQRNTQYKPTFLLEMLEQFPEQCIVYVDSDAEFKAYPVLFDELAKDCTKIALHQLDHFLHRKRKRPLEVLSGTLFLPNTATVYNTVRLWQEQCKASPTVWDQRALEKVVGNNFHQLPEEYCYIFDYKYNRQMKPVIVHYQASRQAKKIECLSVNR